MENIVSDKNRLFAAVETKCHHLKVSEDSDDVLKVWVKEPTWLQVEQALSSVRYMVENFVEKTEPSLSGMEILRLSPYIGAQLKEILPNPFMDLLGDDTGN